MQYIREPSLDCIHINKAEISEGSEEVSTRIATLKGLRTQRVE